MPNLSDKGIYLPPSPIRKLVPFAEAAKRRGIKVYHLNIGQPDIRTPQVAVDAVKNIHDQVFEYGHSAGNESYRRKLADYYRGVGIDVTTDDMVITVGGSEAIFMAMTICLNPGDEVLVPAITDMGTVIAVLMQNARQRFRAASYGGIRTTDHYAHQSDPDL